MKFLLPVLVLAVGLGSARAAEPTAYTVGTLFNWYYATTFGTGVYTSGETTVTAVNLPFQYTLREPSETEWGWRVQLPVATVLGSFTLRDPNLGSLDLTAVSFLPGLELIVPVQPDWRLSAFANLGGAWEFETGTSAALYRAGLSTRYRFAELRDPDLEIGFKYIYAGYGTAGQYGQPISLVGLGVVSSVALPWSVSESRQTRLGVQWGITEYLTQVRFRLPSIGYTEISNEWEAGLSLIFRPAFHAFGATWDRFGLNYVQANNGLHGVRLVTEFPF